MTVHQRYRVTLPGPVGAHADPAVLLVRLVHGIAPGGDLVWADAGGRWRLRIDGEVATVLTAPAGYDTSCPLHAVPMP
ncbi:hypothetical protein CFP65_7165 [Kitasatospora sp. MMS16-BH015]|uniref:DUF6296 family protein n=1 Tax=Kitasatospora sp. MMS16-BH015 TaxID=2018025 RepID=UPI000CA21E56|nr:DUF6296 family protein [Kitasatospora sp. MMS16-BH015]AUG81761.1 hypothetical protein CFP65_7165 [Kitasatospora sp. MMS16-BH015]